MIQKIMMKSVAGEKFAKKPGSQASWLAQSDFLCLCVNKLDCPATCAWRRKQAAWNDQQAAK